MLLWIVIALLTLVAVSAILFPLYFKRDLNISPTSHDLNVYKNQLIEIERDLDNGTINLNEAQAAKNEISRRILNASTDFDNATNESQYNSKPLVIFCALVLVPIFAIGIYLLSGSPRLPDMPIATRTNLPTEQQDISLLIAQVEARLAEYPEDGKGWEVIAPVYLRLQQPEKAVVAYNNVIRFLGPNEVRLTSLGEAIVLANNGQVVAEAISVFERVLEINEDSTKSKFYLALGQSQSGEITQATMSWKNLISEANGDEPWLETAKQQLAALESELPKQTENSGVAPDLSEINLEDFEELDTATRNQMIMGMVEGLNKRLKNEGGSLNEWMQLINSQIVLGNRAEAQDAVNRALKYFSDDQNSIDTISAVAKSANLKIK